MLGPFNRTLAVHSNKPIWWDTLQGSAYTTEVPVCVDDHRGHLPSMLPPTELDGVTREAYVKVCELHLPHGTHPCQIHTSPINTTVLQK